MVSIPAVKKIITKVLDQFGNDIIIRSPGVITYDDWGEPLRGGQTDVSTIGVTDEYIMESVEIVKTNKVEDASLSLLIKGDEIISTDYTIILDGVEYNIMSISNLKVSNVVVAYQLQLNSK